MISNLKGLLSFVPIALVKDLEQFGLSDDLLAAIWLALCRDRRREVCKEETTSAQVTNTRNVLLVGNEPAPSSVPTDGDNVFEVTRYTFKRRLSLPKEHGIKDNSQST